MGLQELGPEPASPSTGRGHRGRSVDVPSTRLGQRCPLGAAACGSHESAWSRVGEGREQWRALGCRAAAGRGSPGSRGGLIGWEGVTL